MGIKVSDKAGTLAGYDIVLSISEEAFNAQLQKLYDTPITRGPLPPPTKIREFAPTPPAKYLINHDFSLHEMAVDEDTNETVKVSHGIDGHIECPRVRFHSSLDKTEGAQYRTAYMEITFKRDETAPAGEKDSVLRYWKTTSKEPKLASLIINGYTMSWEVEVTQRKIQDVMTSLIEPSESKEDSTTVPDKVAKAIKAVDPKLFTVSSMFCVFQEQRIVDSFRLIGPKGEKVDLGPVKAFTNGISKYFQHLQDGTPTRGAPTPDNPFILGYAISQKLPTLKNFDPSISTANTPNFFQPKQYALSVTPGKKQDSGLIATSGTLNYCMFTHRDETTGLVDVDISDLNAGVFQETFFDVIKSFGRTKDANGKTQGCDGIMAFSKEIFSDKWLATVASKWLPNPLNTYQGMLARAIKEDKSAVQIHVNSPSYEADGTGWRVIQTWAMQDFIKTDFDIKKPYDRRKRSNGWCSVTVKYSSDSQNFRTLSEGIDAARRVHLDIEVRNYIHYTADTRGIHNLFQNEGTATGWMNAKSMDCRINSLIRVDINPSQAGMWSIGVDKDRSRNLFKEGETLSWSELSDRTRESWGNFDHFELHHWDKILSRAESDARFRDNIRGWGTETANIVKNGLAAAFSDMGTKVIMPAGKVFMFSGLSTDVQGNLYTQVTYANEADSGVSVTKGKQ